MAKKIVITGAGFAGIYAYLEPHKRFHGSKEVDIALISERDEFLKFIDLLITFRTALEWTLTLFFPRDISRL